ncbi:uncharacterized protein cubi_02848 [Cryptosporidium ubiquitum]|uniref:Uncharacterized protein n=1 Tax=Cryptosporidium ubiquitum TaxID=857276 RepID=A0A1J4MIN9_9CRYT|nr:uncharacterized protein cubi_02848 [Cryptosporidium ubiquitum]OII74046.1 hypothetical protein cubi_02848 [Cryptosporidium ubiquitum]
MPSKKQDRGGCVLVFEKFLDGIGVSGQLRTAYLATSEVVKESMYPMKENCIKRYSGANPTWQNIGSKTSAPNNNPITFTDTKGTETIFSQPSYRSGL